MFSFPFFTEYLPKKIRYLIELEAKVIEMANTLAVLNAKIATSASNVSEIDIEDVETLKEKLEEIRKAIENLETEVMKEIGVEP